MKKVFVSVPMSGRTDCEIIRDISDAIEEYCMKDGLENYAETRSKTIFIHNNDYQMKHYIDPSNAKIPNLVYLGVAINRMANCDDVIFARGWENAKGCQVEKLVYDLYFNKS